MSAKREVRTDADGGIGEAMHARLLFRAFSNGSSADIAHALGIIARARGMTEVARKTGLAREALYRTLSRDGDPKLSTLLRVAHALGIRLEADMVESDEINTGAGRMR